MQINGKTILVTGGTDGIGRELAQQLKAKGASVIITGRNDGRLAQMKAAGCETIKADLSGPTGVDAVVTAVQGRGLDILINNAGASIDHDVRKAMPDLAQDERAIWLNLHAPIHLTIRLLDTLKSRPEAMIVNVTSGLAIAPRAGGAVYCASKAGLRSYTMAMRAQLAETRVHVLEALPPVVETTMTAARTGAKMPANACAAEIVRAIERNAKEANVGQVKLLRLAYSLSPALARRIMLRY